MKNPLLSKPYFGLFWHLKVIKTLFTYSNHEIKSKPSLNGTISPKHYFLFQALILHCAISCPGFIYLFYTLYRYTTKDNFFPQTWQSFLCSNCVFVFPDSRRRLSISGAGPRQLPKLRLRKSTHGAHPFCPSLLFTNQWR